VCIGRSRAFEVVGVDDEVDQENDLKGFGRTIRSEARRMRRGRRDEGFSNS